MNKAIIVTTILERRDTWLPHFLSSFTDYPAYPLIILPQQGWELSRISWMMKNTNYDEFLLLQDTIKLHKPNEFLEMIFEKHQGITTCLFNAGGSYAVKYRRDILKQINFPDGARDRDEAVEYELALHHRYFEKEKELGLPNLKLFDDYNTRFEVKFGRLNMILENEYFTKYALVPDIKDWKERWPEHYQRAMEGTLPKHREEVKESEKHE